MRRKQHFFLLAVFLVTCWLSVSCQRILEYPPECADTEGCSLGEKCEGGTCVVGCVEDTDCPFPHICRLNQCTLQFKCESDANCRYGATCNLSETPSRCVNRACTSDAECASSQRCVHDKCSPRICETDADCPAGSGFDCIKKRCVCTGTCS